MKVLQISLLLASACLPRAALADVRLELSARASPGLPPADPYALPADPASVRRSAGGSAEAALDSVAGADIQARGAPGAQADLSLRGSSFQQALLLVNGVRAADPQTAHFALDLPFTAQDIERAEVLGGPYSALYGRDALAGAVNIVTRRPRADRAEARAGLGDFSSRYGSLSVERTLGAFGQRFSAEKSLNAGYRPGTDLDSGKLYSRTALDLPGAAFDLELGYSDKEFGAPGFYSAVLTGERENTRTLFAAASAKMQAGGFSVEPGASYRRHDDRFAYAYNSASYANRHRTDVSGASLRLGRAFGVAGRASLGAEFSGERLDSSSMGAHYAAVFSAFARHDARLLGGLAAGAALRADRHSAWGWNYSPALRLDWAAPGAPRLWASAGRAFRAPSFTELFYRDPGNAGDPALKPERAAAYELGGEWAGPGLRARGAVWLREESRLIDWVKAAPSSKWTAANIGRALVRGFECSLEKEFLGAAAALDYSEIKKEAGAGYLSKYVLRYPRRKGGLSLRGPLPGGLDGSMRLAAVRRSGGPGYGLADAELSRRFGPLEANLGVTNLFDKRYAAVPGAMAPGRWVMLSLSRAFF